MDTQQALGQEYRPRLIDPVVTEALATAGAVVLDGARGCGKTMTAMHAAASYALLDDPQTADIAAISSAAVLDGANPRLLDEWQLAPQLWNLVRRRVDASTERGLFLLTGSAVPPDDITRHTGAGRMLRLRQRTLTWLEKRGLEGAPGVSLAALFEGRTPLTDLTQPLSYAEVIAELVRPGYPGLVGLSPTRTAAMLRAYINDVARTDAPRLTDLRHEPVVLEQLIIALARSISSEVSYSTLASDIRQVAPTMKPETVAAYLGVLERLFFIEPQLAWTPHLRSRARLRTSAKQHLADPSLAAAALRADAHLLAKDPKTAGLLMESAVVHDLRVLVSPLDGEVRHYRDSNGHEIDAVVTLPDGRWGAVEVKLGAQQVGAGSRSLINAVAQIDLTVLPSPSFSLVITGDGPTYTTTDGVITCSLAALRP